MNKMEKSRKSVGIYTGARVRTHTHIYAHICDPESLCYPAEINATL